MFPEYQFHIINTHIPFYNTSKIYRSLGFRLKWGPLIKEVNNYIQKAIVNYHYYDIIWVDKAKLINPETTGQLRHKTSLLIHYTPDSVFYNNKSHLFYQSINLYNYLITTKSFDREYYLKYINKEKLIETTQGFNPYLHKPVNEFNSKKYQTIFIGLGEKSRYNTIHNLINTSL